MAVNYANLNDLQSGAVGLRSLTLTAANALDYVSITHNQAASGTNYTTWCLKSLIVSNKNSLTGDNKIRVSFTPLAGTGGPDAGNERFLLYDTWVPYNTNLTVIHDQIPLYFQYGDEIRVYLQEGNTCEVYFGYQTLSEAGTVGGGGGGGGTGSTFTFDHQSASTISGTFGGFSRTGTYYNPPNGLATGINYGTQNSSPFSTSTDWNNDIVRAYSYGDYNTSREMAPALAALMERPPQGGTYPYSSNNWESAWWLSSSGYDSADILIVVFDAVKSFSGIQVMNGTDTYSNSSTDRVYASYLVGNAASFTQTSIGDVGWNGSSTPANITQNFDAQAIAVWREGATGWARLENIRFLK